MTIPREKQRSFLRWFRTTAGPELTVYGAMKHELYQVSGKSLVGKQTIEEDRYIELVYFPDDFNIQHYFEKVKTDVYTWKLSRMYEKEFGAKNIELRVITSI